MPLHSYSRHIYISEAICSSVSLHPSNSDRDPPLLCLHFSYICMYFVYIMYYDEYMKSIRVDDEMYTLLHAEADSTERTDTGMLRLILKQRYQPRAEDVVRPAIIKADEQLLAERPQKKSPPSASAQLPNIPSFRDAEPIPVDDIKQHMANIEAQFKVKAAERGTCKNGHILGMNGKCLQKGCKYA